MTIDFIINQFTEIIGNFPVVAFLVACASVGGLLFVLMALNAMVAVYVERKVSAFMMDRLGPMAK